MPTSFAFAWGDKNKVSVPKEVTPRRKLSRRVRAGACRDKITTTVRRAFRWFHTASGTHGGSPEDLGTTARVFLESEQTVVEFPLFCIFTIKHQGLTPMLTAYISTYLY